MSVKNSTWWYRYLGLAFGACIWLGMIAWVFLGQGDLGSLSGVLVCVGAFFLAIPAGLVTMVVELLKRWLPVRAVMIVGVLILVAMVTHGALIGRQMARFERDVISPPPKSLRGLETWLQRAFMFQVEKYYLFTVNEDDFLAIQERWELEDVTPVPVDGESPGAFRERFEDAMWEASVHSERMLQGEDGLADTRLYARGKWIAALRNRRTGRTLVRWGYITP